MRRRLNPIALVAWPLGLAAGLASAAEGPPPAPSAEGSAFFEARIRPVLAAHCVGCHGPKKQSAGLRLDQRGPALAGGDGGPVVVPGKVEESSLIEAIGHSAEPKMPPDAKLPAAAIEALTRWVAMGAPWPEGEPTPADAKANARETHWAFQPVGAVEPPPLKSPDPEAGPIDAFIRKSLDAKGMAPSPRADRRTLIRRATFDLIGLPARPEDVDAFVDDPAPTAPAFAKVVDRLLASPHYGERWGRHWLDVARYADTKGYVFLEERKYPYSYTYRDYVIAAFNADLPYDQFIVEQVAADRLGLQARPGATAAMGFLTVGRRFLNNQQDIIDDRIDAVTRGFMGLSVACARCHDHKFDPIPTDDYYSLYGVFASSTEPAELPELPSPVPPEVRTAFLARLAEVQKPVDAKLAEFRAPIRADLLAKLPEYLAAVVDVGSQARGPKADETARAAGLRPQTLRWLARGWKEHLDKAGDRDPIAAPWLALMKIPAGDAFKGQAAEAAAKFDPAVDPDLARSFREDAPDSPRAVALRYGKLLTASAPEAALRKLLDASEGPFAPGTDAKNRLLDQGQRGRISGLVKAVETVRATDPGSPPRAMVMVDLPTPVEPNVFLRGNPGRPGKVVPRRFLQVLSGPDRAPFGSGSGRLELARAIARPDNPLTSRVMVNRIWMHHFGNGLVRTPSDFGLRGEPPTHPELLDYLAGRFVAEGWSIKAVHRLIMASAAYQQRSDDVDAYATSDPGNALLWKYGRRRLDFESMRDAMLAASGKLDPAIGGRPVDLTEAPYPTRRAVYGFIDRQNLPGLYRTFDFATPDASAPKRFVTVVPQQALFLMNGPFVIEQARGVVGAELATGPADDDARIARLYRRLFAREPGPDELELGRQFVHSPVVSGPSNSVGWQYGMGGFDESTGKVVGYRPLEHFTAQGWHASAMHPSDAAGFLFLNAEGGHAGPDNARSAIRRWVAPRAGFVAINGKIGHTTDKGDGVRARIVSDRAGQVGGWLAHNSTVPTTLDRVAVARGEAIDFVVDNLASDSFDSFTWAPTVRLLDAEPGELVSWDAKVDFAGPPATTLDPWEAYAQVLLLTNEFMYID